MSTITVDAQGLSCPQPVLMTQKTIKEGASSFTVLVSTEVSRENVMRLLEKSGYTGSYSDNDGVITINAEKA